MFPIKNGLIKCYQFVPNVYFSQEEESKIQADIILKEVLRKKHDARKCIVKLDALVKLRKARQNTAKGRGESVSQKDVDAFINNIGKFLYTVIHC